MQKIIILSVLALGLATGCSAHKPEIQQGNIVTEVQLRQLQIGMEPAQVQFLLGSPLLKDPFHQSQWDYYYSLELNGKERTHYLVKLEFKDGRLAHIQKSGPVPPNERDALKLILENKARRPR